MCLGACGTVAGVRQRSRVRRVGGEGWGEKADQGLNFPAISGTSSDFFGYVSQRHLSGRRAEGGWKGAGGGLGDR